MSTQSLRIGIDIAKQSNIDHVNALRAIIGGLTATVGIQARQTLSSRYRLSRLLSRQGHADEARTEIAGVIAAFDPGTDHGHPLLRSARALLALMKGGPADETLIV